MYTGSWKIRGIKKSCESRRAEAFYPGNESAPMGRTGTVIAGMSEQSSRQMRCRTRWGRMRAMSDAFEY